MTIRDCETFDETARREMRALDRRGRMIARHDELLADAVTKALRELVELRQGLEADLARCS